MNEDIKKKWVTRLRRTKKKQGRGALGTSDGERCCLGILCDLAVEAKIIPKPEMADNGHLLYGRELAYGRLPLEVSQWAGLHTDNPIIGDPLTHGRHHIASYANDNTKKTFKEIADLIEEYVE